MPISEQRLTCGGGVHGQAQVGHDAHLHGEGVWSHRQPGAEIVLWGPCRDGGITASVEVGGVGRQTSHFCMMLDARPAHMSPSDV